ncbi:MAG: acyloxyacyl hydrolase [Actinomycetota bacterium]
MLKFRILAYICFLATGFFILHLPVKAQNSVDNQPSDKNAPESLNTKDAAEKTGEGDSESKRIEGRSYLLKRGTRQIEIVPNFAPIQPTFFSGLKEYNTDGRRLAMLNVRFTRTIGTKRGVTYQYLFELTPLAVAFNNEVKNPQYISETETPDESKTIRKTAYGAGFQPVNFRFLFRAKKRVKPFAQVGVGMIFFNQRLPVPEATAYNFTGDFGGGIYIVTDREKRNKAITLSYRYFHLSNFNTSDFNPGYNANVFSIGYSFSR